MSSYVHIKTEPRLWTVGHYKPDGTFEPESDHGNEEEACKRARYLNGGVEEIATANLFTDMTMREWYAGQALKGILSAHSGSNPLPPPDEAAEEAFAYADAMLLEARKEAP